MNSTERHDKDINLLIENVRSIDSIHGTWGIAKSADFTIGDLDHYSVYLMTTGAAGITGTLPSAASNLYRILTFVKVDTGVGTGAITDLGGTWTTLYLINKGDALTLQSDGAIWQVKSGQVQPVSGESSLGMTHYHPSQYAADLYSNTAPAAGTFYTVTATGFPVGTKTIEIVGYIYGTTAGDTLVWRPYGSSDTYAQSRHRDIGIIPANSAYGHVRGTVTIDSSGRFEVACNNTGTDIYIRGWSFYGT